MHKNATKYNKTQSKWCINKHGASKIIDTFEKYHPIPVGVENTTQMDILVDTGCQRLVCWVRGIRIAIFS
jgi:hypothetical protein